LFSFDSGKKKKSPSSWKRGQSIRGKGAKPPRKRTSALTAGSHNKPGLNGDGCRGRTETGRPGQRRAAVLPRTTTFPAFVDGRKQSWCRRNFRLRSPAKLAPNHRGSSTAMGKLDALFCRGRTMRSGTEAQGYNQRPSFSMNFPLGPGRGRVPPRPILRAMFGTRWNASLPGSSKASAPATTCLWGCQLSAGKVSRPEWRDFEDSANRFAAQSIRSEPTAGNARTKPLELFRRCSDPRTPK